jgi:pilus assembly protein CpaB
MDRRLLTVLGMSVVLALVVAAIFYQVSSHAQAKAPAVVTRDVVVATETLPLGVAIKPNNVKIVKIPGEMFPKTGFAKVDDVLDRSVVSPIMADEALLEGRLAPRGSGMGLAPVIPTGMRALAVRVNEIIGVAGFILPGMRVDILVTGRPPQGNINDITTTVLQNITVLSANQQMQPDKGQAINATVVNVLVTPEQAELVTLATSNGRITLVLRNATDQKTDPVPLHDSSELYTGVRANKPKQDAPIAYRPKPPKVVAPPPPPPPPPAPVVVPDEIIMIRGRDKTVEVIGTRKQ